MKQRLTAFLCLLSLLLPLAACAPAETPETLSSIPVLPPEAALPYGDAAIRELGDRLYIALSQTVEAVYGRPLSDEALRQSLADAVACMEARGVPLIDAEALLDALTADTAWLTALLSSWRAGEGLRFSEAEAFFLRLARTLGARTAGLLCYDFFGLYLTHVRTDYEAEAEKHPAYAYLREEVLLWRSYEASLLALGEEKASALLSLLFATANLRALDGQDTAGFFASLSDGELLLFLRAAADALRQSAPAAEDFAFLLRFMGNEGDSLLLGGICYADEVDRYAAACAAALPLLEKLLRTAPSRAIAALRQGDTSTAYALFLRALSDEEARSLLSLFTGEEKAAYTRYLQNKGHAAAYAAFRLSLEEETIDGVLAASEEEFSSAFKRYVNYTSPFIGFSFQKDLERSTP